MTVRTTALAAQADSDSATIPSGTERLLDEPQFGDSTRTYSASDPDSARPIRRGRTLEYHREWRRTPSGKASLRASQRAFQAKHPERVAASRIVGAAVRAGRLEKGSCELAGSACKGRIEAHHDDYTKPLEVRWLCKSHHKVADWARRRAEQANATSIDRVGGGARERETPDHSASRDLFTERRDGSE